MWFGPRLELVMEKSASEARYGLDTHMLDMVKHC